MSTSTSNTTNNSFPKFVTDCRSAADGASGSATATAGSSSTTNNTAASSSGAKGPLPPPPPPPLNLCIVINICHYLTPLAKLIILSQPLDTTSGEAEREAFLALQQILSILDSGKNEPINVFPFLDKFCRYIGTNFSDFEEMDIFLVWDYLIKLITLVIPPLREIFMGRLSLSLDEHAWHSLTTRCVHAQFSHSVQSLEDFNKLTLQQFNKDYYNDLDLYQHRTSLESIKNFNAIILGRAPEILAFAVESPHLPSSLRFLDALSKNPNKMKPPATIKFPASFNMSMKDGEGGSKSCKELQGSGTASGNDEETVGNVYDLAAVVTLEGSNCENAQAFYRYVHEAAATTTSDTGMVLTSAPASQSSQCSQWYKGSGATHDLIDSSRAIERNYFHINDNKKVHPRLLIYAKRGIVSILDQLRDFVTKGGQLRCKGDATFEAAETPEHYDEAKQYYEEAIAYDSSLRSVLQDRLNSLEQIERNQKAQSYENQADLSLGKKRFKEACDLYKLAMRSAVVNSPIYVRIREKEDYMMRIISLEIANHLTEKGEECLKTGAYAQSRENFAQALKLNPHYLHLQAIITGIDKLITAQSSAQKVTEANQAMKVGRYKYANQLFLEAVHLVPERENTLKPILDSLVVLMQGEDALMKQRSGLIALEDKKYSLAIGLITEAIGLLPPESVPEHAFFLCDRAAVYFEMKDYTTSVQDCTAALALRPELAVAYLRLGSAQFELDLFDEALVSYEKATRYDPSLNDQIKVKVRQVNTAKEIQQRKEREAERARIKEEEGKRMEEKRAREEKTRKERQEKLLLEQAEKQAEKSERLAMQRAEQWTRASAPKEVADAATSALTSKAAKENAKEKQKREKVEKEHQKALEKERARAEKEKERDRIRAEKEHKLKEEAAAREVELQKQREFTAEMDRASAKLRDAERAQEVEKERLRLERDRILAEKEKQRGEKEKKRAATSGPVSTPTPVTPPVTAPVTGPVTPGKDKAKNTVMVEKTPKNTLEKGVVTAAAVVAASLAHAAALPVKPTGVTGITGISSGISSGTLTGISTGITTSHTGNTGTGGVDPDFPTLGAGTGAVLPPTILKRAESAPAPYTGPLPAPGPSSTPGTNTSTKTRTGPAPKWSALLSATPSATSATSSATTTEEGMDGHKRPASTSSLPGLTPGLTPGTHKSKTTSGVSSSFSGVSASQPQDDFPPLLDAYGNEIDTTSNTTSSSAVRTLTALPPSNHSALVFEYKEVLEKHPPVSVTSLTSSTPLLTGIHTGITSNNTGNTISNTGNTSINTGTTTSITGNTGSGIPVAVLSSGELKALIATATDTIPPMQLPSAAVGMHHHPLGGGGQGGSQGNTQHDFSAFFQQHPVTSSSLTTHFGLGIFDPKHHPPIPIPLTGNHTNTNTGIHTTSNTGIHTNPNTGMNTGINSLLPTLPEDNTGMSSSLLTGSILNPMSTSFVGNHHLTPTLTGLTGITAGISTGMTSELVEGSQLNANSAAFQPLSLHDFLGSTGNSIGIGGNGNGIGGIGNSIGGNGNGITGNSNGNTGIGNNGIGGNGITGMHHHVNTGNTGSSSGLLGSSSLGGLEHDPFSSSSSGGGSSSMAATRRTSRFTSLFGSSATSSATNGGQDTSDFLLGSIGSIGNIGSGIGNGTSGTGNGIGINGIGNSGTGNGIGGNGITGIGMGNDILGTGTTNTGMTSGMTNGITGITGMDGFGMHFGSSGYGALGGFGGSGGGGNGNTDIFGGNGNGITGITTSVESSRLAKLLGGFTGNTHQHTTTGSPNLDSLKTSSDISGLSHGSLFGVSSGVSGVSSGVSGVSSSGDPFGHPFLDTSSGLIGPSTTSSNTTSSGVTGNVTGIPGLWMQSEHTGMTTGTIPTTAAGLLGLRSGNSTNSLPVLGSGTGAFPLVSGTTVTGNTGILSGGMMSVSTGTLTGTLLSVPVSRKYDLPAMGKSLEDERICPTMSEFQTFPALHRLAVYTIYLYRWAYCVNEWAEYALPLIDLAAKAIELHGGYPQLLQGMSGAEVRVVEMSFRGQRERVLILPRSLTGMVLEVLVTWVTSSCPPATTMKSPVLGPVSSPKLPPATTTVVPPPLTTDITGITTSSTGNIPSTSTGITTSAAPNTNTNKWASLPQSIFTGITGNTTTNTTTHTGINKASNTGINTTTITGTTTTTGTGIASGITGTEYAVTDSMIDALISTGYHTTSTTTSNTSHDTVEPLPVSLPPSLPLPLPPVLLDHHHSFPTTSNTTTTSTPTATGTGTGLPTTATGKAPPTTGITSTNTGITTAESTITGTNTGTNTGISTGITGTTSGITKGGPNLLKPAIHPGTGVAKRYLEIPAELIGLVIGHGGKKIKELATESGSKVQFKTSKTSEREGKPGILELQGSVENVDKAATMVWELLLSVGREYREITGQPSTTSTTTSIATATTSNTTVTAAVGSSKSTR